MGVPSIAVEIATCIGNSLSRPDYQSLMSAGLVSLDTLRTAPEDALLSALNNDHEKLSVVRAAIKKRDQGDVVLDPTLPVLPPYEA